VPLVLVGPGALTLLNYLAAGVTGGTTYLFWRPPMYVDNTRVELQRATELGPDTPQDTLSVTVAYKAAHAAEAGHLVVKAEAQENVQHPLQLLGGRIAGMVAALDKALEGLSPADAHRKATELKAAAQKRMALAKARLQRHLIDAAHDLETESEVIEFLDRVRDTIRRDLAQYEDHPGHVVLK
jgi:hypothetical protein